MVKKGKGKSSGGIDLSDPMPSAPPKDQGKGKKGQKGGTSTPEAVPSGPPKPTVKQLIGGSSWTGKLPVNLLSEYCQKQKWERPDYDTKKTPDGFSVWVTMSAKDPKTQQITKLEPFKIPATHKHLIMRPTAIEAKHAAATYALFRVCSMQNKHTVLPPEHKSLWKEFQALKTQDVKEGKAWMYEPDPFKSLQERQEAKAAAEKKRKEIEAAKAKAAAMPGASGLVLMSNAGKGDSRSSNIMKGWSTAPKVEMGKKTRAQLETLLRSGVKWNPNGVQMSKPQKDAIISELSKLSFRKSHVEEAVEYCKDREETLEWLLIHVPEDDLPRWALPESYAAGVSVGATNLRREGIIKRLAQAGYSLELATRVLDEQGVDEDKAAETLQNLLFPRESQDSADADFLDLGSPEEQWEEEVGSLEAIYGEGFEREGDNVIRIKLDSVKNGQQTVDASFQVRRPATYPANLILSIQNINGIIEEPGKLVDISAVSSAAAEYKPVAAIAQNKRSTRAPKMIKWIKDEKSREQWLRRQESSSLKNMVSKRQGLPAWQMREAIIGTVRSNHVTIISGETGSGKSTQSMQFILDDLYAQGLGGCANMIVTQPRRISALGLADRGICYSGESRRSKDTKITFVTTGVLLRRLQTSGGRVEDVVASLADVSHVVIDEVHERSLDTDFLLNLIRDVMKAKKDMLKLILMSATLDAATFKRYFASEGLSVGTVEIAGRTFPVDEYYLDDVIRMTAYGLSKNWGHRINYNLLVETVKAVDFELSYEKKPGGILIFLPGVGEINQACRALKAINSLHVLPLHASLETREQKECSLLTAERSRRQASMCKTTCASSKKRGHHAPPCKQRRGRAGRVQEGRCYKLFTQNLEQQMPERPEPEIRRVPLEQLCLSVRAMGMKDVAGFLGRSPTPPDATAIDGAMKLLQRMGALDGDELTAMGQQLAMLPADLRCGKLMVFGAIFGCLDDCVTIAAILSTRSPFVSPQEKRDEAKEARMKFYRGLPGVGFMMQDHIPHRQIRSWCEENFLNFQTLSDISNTRAQYYTALGEIGIVAPSEATIEAHARGASSDGSQLLRALKFASSMSGAVELDPEARSIKYFNQENGRVFVHPSSTLFGSQGFSGNAAYMAYFSLISTSKIFIRDLTPFNAYTLLLFSGPIELDTLGRGLLVDGWLRLRGWARIGVLLARLRGMVDELIAKKVESPEMNVKDDEVIMLVRKMIELDGMDA
ncbi:P-loop containing nucleoside triphosphate hydrolase protein [Fusarium oxysporum]|nr:P-loop containing nucleoside triphosphate hydrolase protein [Fusarium oxysporum]